MSVKTSTKVGHALAKGLGIKLEQHNPPNDVLTRGESAYSVDTADTYVEEEPHTFSELLELIPTGRGIANYFVSLFPFTKWILRYNLQWLFGDMVAGITVGAVVVPQSMAYAKLALLDPQYGLYASFMGVMIYWLFATSKDITIGPVAVMSLVVGNIINEVHKIDKNIPNVEIATTLAIICGGIVTALGLLRLGWLVEFIPLTAICAFMTGSALNIAAGQTPAMLGITVQIKTFNTRDSTYIVIINTLKALPHCDINAALGLTSLFMLYAIRYACTTAAKKYPAKAKLFFFISTLRTAFVILLYTMISWLVNKDHRTAPITALLGTVPRGFQHAQVPVVRASTINAFTSQLPAAVIVLLIEHIAISKSFGRINNYTINPSQELVAIGVTNLLGPFLGAYPATGSFSRTAIKSKAGVRTPLAGVITGIVVLLAIYALPAVFFYISNASLAAVIIHAVGDLITPPNTVYQFWRVSPFDFCTFMIGVLVTVFTTIEIGIYVTIGISIVILLVRVVKAKGQFVSKVKVHSVVGDHLVEDKFHDSVAEKKQLYDEDVAIRNVFLPIGYEDGTNPALQFENPHPGIFIYRFSEGFNYPNANHYLDHLVQYIFSQTRRTNLNSYARPGDRPWNDPGPRRGKTEEDRSHLPTLKAVILDLSSVNSVDVTAIQNLIDVRNQLDRYASPAPVQWHLSGIKNRWTKRALASAGFGFPAKTSEGFHRWRPIFSVADMGGSTSAAAHAERVANKGLHSKSQLDLEAGANNEISPDTSNDEIHHVTTEKEIATSKAYVRSDSTRKRVVVQGLNRPFFHLDLTSALQSAIATVEAYEPKRGVGTEESA